MKVERDLESAREEIARLKREAGAAEQLIDDLREQLADFREWATQLSTWLADELRGGPR